LCRCSFQPNDYSYPDWAGFHSIIFESAKSLLGGRWIALSASQQSMYIFMYNTHTIISSNSIFGDDCLNLETNNHSVFSLNYHLVLVVKYRKKVIDDKISDSLKVIFEYIAPKYNVILEEWNHDKDHIHLLFRANPNSEISKFINAYKSASSRLIKKEFPAIRKELWKEYFWSRSFCLITTGGAPIDVVRKYIEEQGMKRGE